MGRLTFWHVFWLFYVFSFICRLPKIQRKTYCARRWLLYNWIVDILLIVSRNGWIIDVFKAAHLFFLLFFSFSFFIFQENIPSIIYVFLWELHMLLVIYEFCSRVVVFSTNSCSELWLWIMLICSLCALCYLDNCILKVNGPRVNKQVDSSVRNKLFSTYALVLLTIHRCSPLELQWLIG